MNLKRVLELNIITVPYGSKGFYVRPGTSLNRDSNDYFCPDGVNELAAAVFIYARATKAGKSVAAKFAPRYYTSIGTGIHLYAPALATDDSPQSWWVSRSLDNSTFLLDDEVAAEDIPAEIIEKINAAFEAASKYVSFRTGDYIAVEIEELPPANSSSPVPLKYKGKEINIIW